MAIVAAPRFQSDTITARFFAAAPRREVLGNVWPHQLPARLRALGEAADLTVAFVDRALAGPFRASGCLAVPTWVCCVRDAVPDVHRSPGFSRNMARDLRRAERGGFAIEASRDPADCRAFFERMVLPYIGGRHGNVGLSLAHLRKTVAHGEMFWVTCEGARVAGFVVERVDERMLVRYIGILDGDAAWLKRGVVMVIYAYAIEHAWRRGLRIVDFGGAAPWLGSGLLRYKIRWEMRPDRRRVSPISAYLKWRDGNGHVAAMFQREGLIVPRADEFAFVAGSGAWPPVLVPMREDRWPEERSVPAPAQGQA